MDKQGEAERTKTQAMRRWLKLLLCRLFAIETVQEKQLKKKKRSEGRGREGDKKRRKLWQRCDPALHQKQSEGAKCNWSS